MKKKSFIIFFLLLFSCENELKINDNWRDVPVVYAVLNSGTQEDADGSGFGPTVPESDFNYDGDNQSDINYTHFVRVQKSFLGSEAAYAYTGIHDSIYYDASDLEVWLELVDNQNGDVGSAFYLDLVDSFELDSLFIFKEDGLFDSSNHYLYRIPSVASDLIPFDDLRKNYKISVFNTLTGDTAFAETNIVEPVKMTRPLPNGSASILRFGVNVPLSIEIKPSKNAKMYSISLIFNYIEQHKDDYLYDVLQGNPLPFTNLNYKSVEWTLSDELATEQQLLGLTNTTIKKIIYGPQFFEFLKTQITEQDLSDPDFYRYPLYTHYQGTNNGITAGIYHRCVDLDITAVNTELYTYLNANAPNVGLNQERPEYNNIVNGIGHLSSRSILTMNNLRIDQSTMDSLSFGQVTKNLNFACYSTLGTQGLTIKFGFDCEEN